MPLFQANLEEASTVLIPTNSKPELRDLGNETLSGAFVEGARILASKGGVFDDLKTEEDVVACGEQIKRDMDERGVTFGYDLLMALGRKPVK